MTDSENIEKTVPQDEQWAQLIRKRGAIKARCTRFTNYVRNFKENDMIEHLQVRLERFERLYDEFEIVQTAIESMREDEDDDTNVNEQERKHFEDAFYAAAAFARRLIRARMTNVATNVNAAPTLGLPTTMTTSTDAVRLPVINLPEFDGKYENWSRFKEAFDTLVDSNPTLSNVQKFIYLTSFLKGSAIETIEALEISNNNYPIALNLLEERYDNKKLIINTHVRAIFDLETVQRENYAALRKLLDQFLKHYRALEALQQPVQHWDTLLIHILTNKLDIRTRRSWETTQTNTNLPTLQQLTDFLKGQCQILETTHTNAANTVKPNQYDKTNRYKTLAHAAQTEGNCPNCKGSHSIYRCANFVKLTTQERTERARSLKLCTNCLARSHSVQKCRSRGCYKCNKAHHTLLHADEGKEAVNENVVTTHCVSAVTHGILSTAYVNIEANNGTTIKARALIDSGSDSSYITSELHDKLRSETENCVPVTILGVNGTTSKVTKKTSATIRAINSDYKRKMTFLVINKITQDIPLIQLNARGIEIPKDIKLADDTWHIPGKIDILIGVEAFYELIQDRRIHLGRHKPVLRETKLGWILTGRIDAAQTNNISTCNVTITNESLDEGLRRFWSTEENGVTDAKERLYEEHCEKHFKETSRRDDEGRYVVALPFNERKQEIGKSLENATNRFLKLEGRLCKNAGLKHEYVKFMDEYEKLGHMSKIQDLQEQEDEYYIPHHPVIKATSSTTKLRVVFDASAPTDTGVSLNDALHVGPTVQSELFTILLRFRKHNIILTADVEKMFRQVLVRKEDRKYQRIVWRAEPEQPLATYELNTVTYGTGPATFLTTRCIADLARQHENVYPQASKALQNDTYVDDVITGAETEQDAIRLRNEMMKIMKSGCFTLRKWSSNNPKVLDAGEGPMTEGKHFLKDVTEKKTLGVVWEQTTDVLRFTAEEMTTTVRNETKRTILSTIARVFDPLGLLSPIIINSKILLQQLWLRKLGWDEPIPHEIQANWDWLKRQINELNDIQVPRRVFCKDAVHLRLCGFCDSSEKAYGAAIYCRTEDTDGNVHVALLCSKSRVAPVKTISLPRLELCGALLLAKLMRSALNALDEKTVAVNYFTDSTIVLNWINSQPSRWKQFVANRVSKIQNLSDPTCWNHVAGRDNPADIVSRGMSTQQLRQSNWWTGPNFLMKDPSEWPAKYTAQMEDEEARKTKVTLTVTTSECHITERYSTLNKALRVTAYCLRFYKKARFKDKSHGPLVATEMQEALMRLIKLSQHENFMTDLNDLKARGQVRTTSRLVALAPYLDEDGVLRVGGRLKYSDLDDNTKNPIILPKRDSLTKLIIRHEHNRNYHAGAQATLAAVRQRYWPIAGMTTVKNEVRKCVICFKFAPRNTTMQMAPLPEERVTPSRPFTHTALDMAGPFVVKESKFRNKRLIKSYACIFVCFASKAVHIELVTDLSCETFLACIQRFIARRGIPKTFYSDNGRSFVAADKELRQAFQNRQISTFLCENNICWKFMPPRAPHFGGLHEAAVKSMKRHLKRVTKNVTLTYEGLVTILTRVESILNSRPLYAISDHPNDPIPLTPGHFLIGHPLNALPDKIVENPRSYKISDYHKLCQITRSFWERWRREYLVTLQARVKWRRAQGASVKVGDVVLLEEDNVPPQCWPMGRIASLHPGADGVFRVATVKTKNGVTQRATKRLHVLPIEEEN